MIDVENISSGYLNEVILKDISFRVNKGEFFGVIGPNGSGKTTLLKTISRILSLKRGTIHIKDKRLSQYSTKDFAKLVAVLPQNSMQTFSYTVKETVALGRYAHQQGLFQSIKTEDESIIQDVMQQTGVESYQNELIDTLSGGERQRVFLAQALAQDPEILLLDEPTNHLDLAYQKELLDVLKQWTNEKDLTVISIFHDLNLAGLYCDRLLLLQDGKNITCDRAVDVLQRDRIIEVYGTAIVEQPHPSVAKTQMMLVPHNLEASNHTVVTEDLIKMTKTEITIQTDLPLRTMTSGGAKAGIGWYTTFINRYNDFKNPLDDISTYTNDTVNMMRDAKMAAITYCFLEEKGVSALIVVMIGKKDGRNIHPFIIDIWVMFNGDLKDDTFIQSVMTATEAKVNAVRDMNLITYTGLSSSPTDSIIIGASQQGQKMSYSDRETTVEKIVREGVYQCTTKALESLDYDSK